jgi:DNA binding domain, excisionase family
MDSQLQMVTTTKAMELLGLSRNQVIRLIEKGEIPAYRFGREYRLKLSELRAYLESCRVTMGGDQ